MSKKKNDEKIIARRFLDLYNPLMGSNFLIEEVSEPEDVKCRDHLNDKRLNLQISYLQTLEGDIKHELGHRDKPTSPITHTAVVTFNDAVEQLENQLEDKLLSNFGLNTALVYSQVSILWEPKEWKAAAPRIRNGVLLGKEHHYGAGVWIICTDNTVSPTGNALVCLSDSGRQSNP